MALIKCKECGNQISDQAKNCPICGATPKKKTSAITWVVLVCLVGGFIQVMFSLSSNNKAGIPAPPVAVASGYDLNKMEEIKSITVRGQKIKRKNTADHVFSILKKEECVWQTDSGPQESPAERIFVKDYLVDGKKYSIALGRVVDPGPYVVVGLWREKE